MSASKAYPWDPSHCREYIIQVIGNTEHFPRTHAYSPGFMEVLLRLMERYGEDYYKSCAHVLRAFLEDFAIGTSPEKDLWSPWRLDHSNRVVSDVQTQVQ